MKTESSARAFVGVRYSGPDQHHRDSFTEPKWN